MKPRQITSRESIIPKSRWLAYATASAATALAGSHVADAAIHYSGPVNHRLPGDQSVQATFQLDQPGDSIAFQHLNTFRYFYHNLAGFAIRGVEGAGFRGYPDIDYNYVSRVRSGRYASHGHFAQYRNENHFVTMARSSFTGKFAGPGIGFIAFGFNGGAGRQYGWVRVRMSDYLHGHGFEVVDYAYADPGEPIKTGQTSSDEPKVPVQGSLGLLAFGAAGLLAWRKSRSVREEL